MIIISQNIMSWYMKLEWKLKIYTFLLTLISKNLMQ